MENEGGKKMFLNEFVAQRLAEERMKDAVREVERRRLIQAARRSRKRKAWWLTAMSIGSQAYRKPGKQRWAWRA
jgi:hypothetical protein